MIVWGIDYGSKMAGTTAIASWNTAHSALSVHTSVKKQDADAFIKQQVQQQAPQLIALDAPLSLPKVYKQELAHAPQTQADFFFREGDRQLNAMSPMFLGGLTARAMKLKHELHPMAFIETYPAQQAKRLALSPLEYKKSTKFIPKITEVIFSGMPEWNLSQTLNSWHEVDAILALIAAQRYLNKIHEAYGEPKEGCIVI